MPASHASQEECLAQAIAAHCAAIGDLPTAVEGLSLFRREQPCPPSVCLLEPSIVLLARGEKQLWAGGEGYPYDPSGFLVTSLDLPANSEVLRVEDLAASVHMSAPTFHHHFRQLTAMSPLQYQKWLRLTEARRLMLNEHRDVSSAAFEVGYESASQFSREYSRLFGAAPSRDITALRGQEMVEVVAGV